MRYAIYFTPSADDPLSHAAANWLGRNPHDGAAVTVEHDFADLVVTPQKYGFHGTLKAPFRLAENVTEQELFDRFELFLEEIEIFDIPQITLDRLGQFFALVPSYDCEPLNKLAAQAVRVFEAFRAPLTQAEFAKRAPDQLSAPQRANLERWGYPYVFDEFRFHMTLTGPVASARSDDVHAALERHFGPFIGQSLHVESCALFVQPEPDAPFHVYSRKKTTR